MSRQSIRWPLVVAITLLASSVPAVAQTLLYLRDSVPDDQGYAIVDVVLETGDNVGGVQADIIFDNTILELAARDCRINPDLGLFPLGPPPALSCLDDVSIGPCKNLSSVLNRCGRLPAPAGCLVAADETLSAFRAIVASTAAPNNNSIPSTVVVYSCRFRILDTSRLPALFRLENVVASDPVGRRLEISVRTGAVCDPTGDCSVPFGCLGNVDCESLHCEPAPGGSYPGTCAAVPTRTPTPSATATPNRLMDGERCSSDRFCASDHCTDGVCCSVSSCPQDEFCNVSYSPGSCARRFEIGAGCVADGDCISLNCDVGAGGTCAAMRTPRPTSTQAPPTPTATLPTPQPQGRPCTADAACTSGFCVHRTCCGTPSCPLGQVCSLSTAPGVCSTPLALDAGCVGSGDCASGNCTAAGVCGPPHTPTPLAPGASCLPGECASGYCVNDTCCEQARCEGPDRCDILGFEGRCVPPLPEGAECTGNADCAPPMACLVDNFGARRCTIILTTPTLIPPRTPRPVRKPSSDDGGGPSFSNIGDNGCSMSPRPSWNGVAWPLAIAAVIGIARRSARRRSTQGVDHGSSA